MCDILLSIVLAGEVSQALHGQDRAQLVCHIQVQSLNLMLLVWRIIYVELEYKVLNITV